MRTSIGIALCFCFIAISSWAQPPQSVIPSIQKVQTTLDPANGDPHNIRITLYSSGILKDINAQVTLKSIAADGQATALASPTAGPVSDNPTAIAFLIPLDKLSNASEVSYQVSLKAGDQPAQTLPEMRITLEPVRAIQQQSDEIENLIKQLIVAKGQIAAAVDAWNGTLPDTPVFVAKRFNGPNVMVQFTTNRPGLLHAKLIRTSDKVVVSERTETQPDVSHTFSFANGFAGTKYYVEVCVYDPKSKSDITARTLTGLADASLTITMPTPPSKPGVSNLAITKKTSKSFSFAFDIDRPAAIQVSCFRIPDTSKPDIRLQVSALQSFTKDNFAMVNGPVQSGHKEFSCNGLDPQQTYLAQIEAVDDFNQALDDKATISSQQLASPLDFEGPVQVTISASGVQVSWKATITGASATMTFDPGNGKAPATFPVPASDKTFSATFGADKLADSLPVDPAAAAKTSSKASPVLTAKMVSGDETVIRAFQVSVAVPSSKQSVPQVLAKAANDSSASGLNKVADGVQNPTKSKFSWQDLLQTGIGALIKLI